MRRLLLAAWLLLLLGAGTGCTSSDREYFRNHIVVLPASGRNTAPPAVALSGLPQ